MILDTLDNCERYSLINPLFKRAFDFIKNNNLKDMPLGKYEIAGEALFAIISKDLGRKREEAPLEAHRKYIDIQFLLDGTEEIGWKPIKNCEVKMAYDEQRDIEFYKDTPTTWIRLIPQTFAIFFPEDAHAPMVSDEHITKVVIKIQT